MSRLRKVTAGAVALSVMGMAMSASAEEDDGPKVFDWPSQEAPALVQTEEGVVFIGKDRQPYRAYHWDAADGEKTRSSFIIDLDQDGSPDFIGAGDPTFAVKTNSDPLWNIEGGCDQVVVADFYQGDDVWDVMCRNRGEISIYTHDKQEYLSMDLGVSMDWCRAGDINGDLVADLECKYRGRDSYVRIDSEGEIIAEESEETRLSDDAVTYDEPSPVDAKKVLAGEAKFDLDGDGSAEENLLADGKALVFQSASAKKALARVELGDEVKSALVKNLDGKDAPEVVAVTDEHIVVLSGKGKKLGEYPVEADDYKRYPVAQLDSVYANGFADNGKAQKAVEDAQKELAKCYSRRVRGNLVVGIGQVILKVFVDEKGEVTDVEKVHSAINDKKVESCAEGVLDDLDYPKAKTGEDEDSAKATVNVRMKFTFADKPK